MRQTPPLEMARRVRAAIAYSGLTYRKLAEATEIPEPTLVNMGSKARPSGQTHERLEALAAACEVPLWVLTRGFEREPTAGESQLNRLERQASRIESMLLGETKSLLVSGDEVIDQLGRIEGALSESAVEEVDRIVRGIVADVESGKLTVPPRASKPRATKRAAKRTRAA